MDLSRTATIPREIPWELQAQAITVRIRWFGLCIGYAVVNLAAMGQNQAILNAILTLGAVYALLDTSYTVQGRVLLNSVPQGITLMEAVFIGLLCHFDTGVMSPFRFYYFLSLIVCALQQPPQQTWFALAQHVLSYAVVGMTGEPPTDEARLTSVLTPVLMGWVAWAGTSLAELLKSAGRRTSQLVAQLRENQALLEERIEERTRQLQESQAMLVQHEKQAAFGLLAAGIAHEVGNPLAAISSLVQLLQRRPLDDHTREKLQMVDDQLRRIQRTLRELVDFSRPTNNELVVCQIESVVEDALSIAKYYKRKKGKSIETDYVQGLAPVKLMRGPLVQVMLNLVLNAMDATEEGGTIAIRTAVEGSDLVIEVADDGHGIEPDHQQQIFAPYFTTKETGTGLGLFVCRNLVEHIGGRIELAKSDRQGTTFRIVLTQLELRPGEEVAGASLQVEPRD